MTITLLGPWSEAVSSLCGAFIDWRWRIIFDLLQSESVGHWTDDVVWAFIWRCPAPPKVRTFTWRLITDCLPTWINKKRRGLEVSDQCPLCAMEPEDTFHAFCRCPRAVALWQAMAEQWQIPAATTFHRTGTEWLAQTLCDLPDTERM